MQQLETERNMEEAILNAEQNRRMAEEQFAQVVI